MSARAWVCVIFAAVITVFLTLPYIVAYVLPVAVIGLAVGWLWLRSCYVSPSERSYARPVLAIPATFTATFLVLQLLAPSVEPPGALKKGPAPARRAMVVSEPPDRWASAFKAMRDRWYVAALGWRPGETHFDFEHVVWILWVAVGAGAPIGFALLYPRDFGTYRSAVMREGNLRENERLAYHAQQLRGLEAARTRLVEKERQLDGKVAALKHEMFLREKEVESLRQQGKLPRVEVPRGPGLDDFL